MPSRASLLFAVLIASTCIALADTVPIVVPGAPAGSTVALAINNKGDIVGDTFIGSGERLVGSDFVDINGAFSLFTLPGSVSFIPSAINDAGQIVGNALDGHSYLYSGGAFSPIDIPGAEYVIANGINDSGEIVGLYTDAFGGHGFSEKNGVVTTINVPGSLGTIATGINNNGDIVGYYGVRDAEDQPARVNVVGFLEKDGVFSTFSCPGYPGGLYTGVLGFGDTEPNAINDAGQIVGLCGPMVGLGDTYGFSDSGGVFSLADPAGGGVGTRYTGINDSGQIVGFYADYPTSAHSFVLTATPEPAPRLLVAAAIALLIFVTRRRIAGTRVDRP